MKPDIRFTKMSPKGIRRTLLQGRLSHLQILEGILIKIISDAKSHQEDTKEMEAKLSALRAKISKLTLALK